MCRAPNSARSSKSTPKRAERPSGRRRATKMFAKMDADGDSVVTLDEMTNRALAMFDARDLNKNGTIDAAEMPAAASASADAAKAGHARSRGRATNNTAPDLTNDFSKTTSDRFTLVGDV